MERIINKLKVSKKNIICFILGAIIFSAISVYAATYFPSNQVTYDNKTSGLKSSDVQGAIDELYNTCSSVAQSGDYLYYAVNRYEQYNDYALPYGGTLYRCNADGESCTIIAGASRDSSFGSVYANNKYMYYAINNYSFEGYASHPNGGTLYRCNADGGSCTIIAGASRDSSFGSVYANNKYMYYAINKHSFEGYDSHPNGGTLYRCNADGGSCTTIAGASRDSSFG